MQEISEEDALAEGVERYCPIGGAEIVSQIQRNTYRNGFRKLWDEINGKRGYSWQSNPWCWALTFKVVK